MKTTIAILTLGLCSCVPPSNFSENLPWKEVDSKILVSQIGSIVTVTHDGHKFVIWDGSQCGTMLHHPDCPCGKDKP